VRELEYSAYESMAEREMADILSEAAARFGTAVEAEHRTGRLAIGDAAVIVVASHAHRGPAFDACRWTLEEIKRRVPIWKRETYDDGSSEWVEPATSEVSA
jgi:molybdopterin synthase catalytic subunit